MKLDCQHIKRLGISKHKSCEFGYWAGCEWDEREEICCGCEDYLPPCFGVQPDISCDSGVDGMGQECPRLADCVAKADGFVNGREPERVQKSPDNGNGPSKIVANEKTADSEASH